MQNTINTILKELRHSCIAQVAPPVQNLQSCQVADKKQIEDKVRDISKKEKVEAPDFGRKRDVDFFCG